MRPETRKMREDIFLALLNISKLSGPWGKTISEFGVWGVGYAAGGIPVKLFPWNALNRGKWEPQKMVPKADMEVNIDDWMHLVLNIYVKLTSAHF